MKVGQQFETNLWGQTKKTLFVEPRHFVRQGM